MFFDKAIYIVSLQGSATCSSGTLSNFQCRADRPSFTYQFCYDSQEVFLPLTCTKIRM